MLKALNIRNFALVAELDIEFGPGLTVITGESGAGKSILLDALSLVLGARVRRTQLRAGAGPCDVSAEFGDLDAEAVARLTDLELKSKSSDEAAVCLVRRTATAARSRAFVNGIPATLDMLRAVTAPLIDVHAQDEHRQLLLPDVQRRMLDDFGVESRLVEAVATGFEARRRCADALSSAQAAVRASAERKSLLSYQLEELAALGGDIHRVDELTALHRRLHRAQEWTTATADAITTLEDGLLDEVTRLATALEGIDDDHARLRTAIELVHTGHAHFDEALGELRRYLDALPEDLTQLAQVEGRLETVHDIARKQRVRADGLAEHLGALQAEYEALSDEATRIDDFERASAEAESAYMAAGEALSLARRAAAAPFCERVKATVAQLGLANAEFSIDFQPRESAAGLESVEFRIATSPNLPSGSLADFASGGERARFALAIEVVAAESSSLPCLILDEADVGVGGTTADVVGRLLKALSKRTQVIAITHAPQVAALADTHLRVSRPDDHDTVIEELTVEERTEELARMLGGRTVTAETRSYARTLLADANAPAPSSASERPAQLSVPADVDRVPRVSVR